MARAWRIVIRRSSAVMQSKPVATQGNTRETSWRSTHARHQVTGRDAGRDANNNRSALSTLSQRSETVAVWTGLNATRWSTIRRTVVMRRFIYLSTVAFTPSFILQTIFMPQRRKHAPNRLYNFSTVHFTTTNTVNQDSAGAEPGEFPQQNYWGNN